MTGTALGADRAFAPRFSVNDTGNIALAANSLLTCSTPAAACSTAKSGPSSNASSNGSLDNNAYTMANVDTDADASTFNSSSANLGIPAGSTVLWAGLYWGGDFSGSGSTAPQNATNRNKMKLKLPGAGTYTDITASVIDESALNVGRYQAFADVTSLVQSGGAGNYFGANVQAGRSADHYAGWSLIVAYRNTSEPARNLTVFDGLKTIRSSDGPTEITVSGFRTPPSGPVNSNVGFVAYEGDLGIVGDAAKLNTTTLTDPNNPASNFFNGSIEPNPRNPSNANNFGFDADVFQTTNVLANNATSAKLTLTTSGDQYLPGALFVATELYAPKITQTKTVTDVNGGETLPGDVLEYTITNTNSNATGTDAATGFVLRDPIPNDTSYVPGSLKIDGAARTDSTGDDTANFDGGLNRIEARLGTGATASAGGRLAAGASSEVKFRVTVGSPLPDDRTIRNNATASFFSESIGTPLTATSNANKQVGAPDLTIHKTRTSGPINAGSPVDYEIDVENVGDATTLGIVTVSDTLPAGLSVDTVAGAGWSCSTTPPSTFTCTRANGLAPGNSYPPILVTADTDPGLTGAVTNTARVSGGSDVNYDNNSGTDTTDVGRAADISVTKSAGPSTINVGETSTFTIQVHNGGPSTATSVGLDDPIPPGLEQVGNATTTHGTCEVALVVCDLGDLAPGETATVTVTVRATSWGAGRTINNVATAKSTGATDPTPGNNHDDADVTVRPVDLGVVKTLAPNPPVAGGPATYSFVATNHGPSNATGVTLRDGLPGNLVGPVVADDGGADCAISSGELICDIGALAAGASVTIEVSGTISGGTTHIANTASINGAEIDPNPVNDTSTVEADVTPRADLSVLKTSVPNSANAGDEVVYQLTATNDGPSTALSTVITDTLPAGVTFVSSPDCTHSAGTVTCELGDIPAGGQRPATVRVSINSGAPPTITNTATVDSDVEDPDPDDNKSSSSVSVADSADISIEKHADVASAAPGDTITYTLTVRNDGPSPARDVTVSDTIPAGLTFVSSTPGSPTCAESGGVLVCDLGDVPSGGTRTITVTATADPAAAPSDHQHRFRVERVQRDLTLQSGETGSVSVPCPSGYFATDASVLILDNAGNVEGEIEPEAVEQDGDGYEVTVTNPSGSDNIQTRVSIVCLGYRTESDGNPSHDHPLVVSAPVSRTEALGSGTYTYDLECGPGQVAVAPSFAIDGDPVRVRGSFRNGSSGWRFVLDSSGGATVDLAVRCLSEVTGEAGGHVHRLALTQQTRTVTVQSGQTVTERVECGPSGKGIVASFDLDPGLLSLGNEPQPVNRDFRIENPSDSPRDARLGLLCIGEMTADPPAITEYENSASVSSTTPDPDSGDRIASATVNAAGPSAPPAPFAPPAPGPGPSDPGGPSDAGDGPDELESPASLGDGTLGKSKLAIELTCSEDCAGTATVFTPRKVHAAGITISGGQPVGRGHFDLAAGERATLNVKLGKRKSKAIRKAKLKTLLVDVAVAGRDTTTERVRLG